MIAYLINLYHRALSNQALTPKERAGLKAVQGVIIGFVADIAYQIVPILVKGGTVNFTQAGVMSLLLGFVLALIKLWAAQSDPLVGATLDAYSKELEQQGIKGITAKNINGVVHVPAVHLVIPSTQAFAATTFVPTQEIVPSATQETAPTPSLSHEVQIRDREQQFIQPEKWEKPPIDDVDTVQLASIKKLSN